MDCIRATVFLSSVAINYIKKHRGECATQFLEPGKGVKPSCSAIPVIFERVVAHFDAKGIKFLMEAVQSPFPTYEYEIDGIHSVILSDS